jgi:hypothetical protein
VAFLGPLVWLVVVWLVAIIWLYDRASK